MTSKTSEFSILRDVPQTMRDGTVLRADVYLPDGPGPFPALLERTPYSKDNSPEIRAGTPPFFTAQGYAVVIQDVRGRFRSEGSSSHSTTTAGAPTRTATTQSNGWPPSRGVTGRWAPSAAPTRAQPSTASRPRVRRTCAPCTPASRPPTITPSGSTGAARSSWPLCWAGPSPGPAATWPSSPAATSTRRLAELDQALAEIDRWQRRLPLNPNPLLIGLEDWYNDCLSHPDDGPFWHRWNIARQHSEIDAPICHLGGWFDIFLAGTLKNFTGLRANARTQAARAPSAWWWGRGSTAPGTWPCACRAKSISARSPCATTTSSASPGSTTGSRAGPRPTSRRCSYSSWARTTGAAPKSTRCPTPATPIGTCTPAAAWRGAARRRRAARRLPLRPRRPGAHPGRRHAQNPRRRLRPAAHRGALSHLHQRAPAARPDHHWAVRCLLPACPRRPTPIGWCG